MTQQTSSAKMISGVVVEKDEPRPWARWLSLGGAAVVGLAIIVGGAILLFSGGEPPRLNDDPSKIAAFAISDDFSELPFDRQVAYLKKMDDSEKELVEAYRGGKLNEEQFSKALQAAYYGRTLRRMENYHERRTQKDRDAYLDKLLEKKQAEKKGTPWQKKDGSKVVLSPDAKNADDVKHIERDESAEAEVIKGWPAEIQDRWTKYHQAMDERKKLRKEKERLEQEAAGKGGAPVSPK